MGRLLWSVLIVVALAATIVLAVSPNPAPGRPQYTGDSQLLRPGDYREWIFLSSGLGMSYGAHAGDEMFTNVFVPQWAYQEFLRSGKWPDKTMFVVEDRRATSKGSINKSGHYQTDRVGIGVEVKDDSHVPEKWAYFSFDEDAKSARDNPKAACWSCHDQKAAVEHSFVQFYPTLKPIAKKFGTYRESAENVQ
jgi:hypothetical protein